MTITFEGKTVLVTGGSSGLGLAAAHRFIDDGATVWVVGRREVELAAAVAALGERAIGIRGDITSQDDLDRIVSAIREAHGSLDVLVANAGAGLYAMLGSYTKKFVEESLGLNLVGTIFTVQTMLPIMGGWIVYCDREFD